MRGPYSWVDRPCAAAGFMSYRYRGPHGWIMIGAVGEADALQEAARSLTGGAVEVARLERWDEAAGAYVPCREA